jgi:hypothetical protein
MATRLYPITEDPAKLEKMAGVPAGTSEVLKAIESRFVAKPGETSAQAFTREEQEFYAINAEPNAAQLHCFLLFGWGRMRKYIDPIGNTTDPKLMAEIGRAQGINVPADLCEGFCWS